ncbi:MAG: SRPBCC family protein, partial [Alphaproteobacteria bacterium]|nr:SRPBCC family protein [Alphaproteobacteria bacterium]
YRCWTEAELLKQWFAPKPFTTPVVEFELRPGGGSLFIMESPEGQKMPNPGQFLEIVPNEKLVFTDAFVGDWRPREGKPFMTAIITFADEGGKTRYTARVLHWTAEDKAQHEQMGFHTGWGQCADQLEALAKTL